MSFGKMPIANSFLKKNQFNKQYFYNMEAGFCNTCFTFQLIKIPKDKILTIGAMTKNHKDFPYVPCQLNRIFRKLVTLAENRIELLIIKGIRKINITKIAPPITG